MGHGRPSALENLPFGRLLPAAASATGCLAIVTVLLAAAGCSSRAHWAYPGRGEAAADVDSTDRLLRIPGSPVRYSRAQLDDRFAVPDWWPGDHPPAPAAVGLGRPPAVPACAGCHLIDGSGAPGNAVLAGLDARYIASQIEAMRTGARAQAGSGWRPSVLMHAIARGVTPAEATAAARYFATLPRRSKVRVEEAATIPAGAQAGYAYRVLPGRAREALGRRIIEVAVDPRRYALRDSRTTFVAYVPPGSIGRGARLAQGVAGRTPACASCHGGHLQGDIGPPLAQSYPTYLYRQLTLFQSGGRTGGSAEMMRTVAKHMSERDKIDLAAYIASGADRR